MSGALKTPSIAELVHRYVEQRKGYNFTLNGICGSVLDASDSVETLAGHRTQVRRALANKVRRGEIAYCDGAYLIYLEPNK